MNLTLCENKKIDLLRSEIQILTDMVEKYDNHIEFTDMMYSFLSLCCHDLEEKERQLLREEIITLHRMRDSYKFRITESKDLVEKMQNKSYRLYDQNFRVHRFVDSRS
jgi:hypothetical protein